VKKIKGAVLLMLGVNNKHLYDVAIITGLDLRGSNHNWGAIVIG